MGDEREPEKKGGAGSKLLTCCCLFFIVMLVLGAALLATFKRNVSDDPAVAAARLPDFVNATLPPGYGAVGVARMPFFAGVIFIAPAGVKAHELDPARLPLLLVIADPPADSRFQQPQDVVKQLRDMPTADKLKPEAEAGDAPATRTVKVRGEDVVVLEQRVSVDGTPTRRVIALVPRSKGDPHLLGIVGWGKAEGFDQAAFDAFLGSIQ